jgi:hypothetical protein
MFRKVKKSFLIFIMAFVLVLLIKSPLIFYKDVSALFMLNELQPCVISIRLKFAQRTVSRRVVINPESDSSKFCFWVFCWIVNTPTKKTPKYWTPGYPRFPSMGLQSQNFGENVIFFWLWNGQLWKLISRVLFGFCSAYIYTFERFFSQLFNGVYDIFVSFAVFRLQEKI